MMFSFKLASAAVIALGTTLAVGGCAVSTADTSEPETEPDALTSDVASAASDPSAEVDDEADVASDAQAVHTDDPYHRRDHRGGAFDHDRYDRDRYGRDRWDRDRRQRDRWDRGWDRGHRHERCAWNDWRCRDRQRRHFWW